MKISKININIIIIIISAIIFLVAYAIFTFIPIEICTGNECPTQTPTSGVIPTPDTPSTADLPSGSTIAYFVIGNHEAGSSTETALIRGRYSYLKYSSSDGGYVPDALYNWMSTDLSKTLTTKTISK
jgi:hypothetical protein